MISKILLLCFQIFLVISSESSALAPPSLTSNPPSRDSFAKVASDAVTLCLILAVGTSAPAFADEIGVEKDAPTLYTGETVEVCHCA